MSFISTRTTALMAGARAAAAAGAATATFVSSGTRQFLGTPDTFSIPTGAGLQEGDLLVIGGVFGGASLTATMTVNGSGATMSEADNDLWPLNGWRQRVFYKVLTSADISTGTVTASGTGIGTSFGAAISVYRGATSVVSKGFDDGNTSATDLVFPGFDPHASTKGVIAIMADRNTGAATVAATDWATARTNATITFFRLFVLDRLSGYTNATVTFATFATGGGGNLGEQAGHILELQ